MYFSMDIVDEDELLYGESSLPFTSAEDTQEQQKTNDRYVLLAVHSYVGCIIYAEKLVNTVH